MHFKHSLNWQQKSEVQSFYQFLYLGHILHSKSFQGWGLNIMSYPKKQTIAKSRTESALNQKTVRSLALQMLIFSTLLWAIFDVICLAPDLCKVLHKIQKMKIYGQEICLSSFKKKTPQHYEGVHQLQRTTLVVFLVIIQVVLTDGF